MSPIVVAQQPEKSRFVAKEGESKAGRLLYRLQGDRVDFYSTEVKPEFEGCGVGGRLVGAAFDFARREDLKVETGCWFAKGWAERHPEVHDMLYRG